MAANPATVGEWGRKVRLAPGEVRLRSARGARFGSLGVSTFGTLTLTTQRIIWTPWWFPWDPRVRIVNREEVLSVSQKRRFILDAHRTELQVKTKHGTLKFGLDPRLLPSRLSDEWVDAIRGWIANSQS
jgi:hypothetical protein